MSKISIIVPTYNLGGQVIKTLTSLERQSYKDFEVIVVNDGSTDDTQTLLETYARLGSPFPLKTINQGHLGANISRNNGFKYATGDYLLFLDADKNLVESALDDFRRVLDSHYQLAFVYCDFVKDGIEHKDKDFDEENLRSGKFFIDSCSMIRREYFPGFDENLKRLQDWDLWLSIIDKNGTGVHLGKVLFETSSREGDITSTEDLKEASNYIRKKHIKQTGLMSGLVDIIILRFNTPEFDVPCLDSIIKNTDYPFYQLTVFDNYYPRFTLSKVWNILTKKSLGEYICLLNNDTRVYKGWLRKMVEVFTREQNVGAVGPSTNQCYSPQKIEKRKDVPTEYEVVDFLNTFGKTFQLSGFCLLFPKRIWLEVGGFNEKFGLYAQENEFLHRVQKAGYKTLWRKDAYIWHYGEASGKKMTKNESLDIEKEREKGNRLYQQVVNSH